MRGFFRKYIAFVMALVLALSAFALLPVGAQSTDRYFVFDYLEDENGGKYIPEGARLTLPVTSTAMFGSTENSMIFAQSNAFYISLQNDSNANRIRISYTYDLQGELITHVAEAAISTFQGIQKLTLPAAHAGETVQLSVSFLSNEAISGSVTLHALFDVSSYAKEAEDEVVLSRCHYNAEGNELQIQGSLSYAATVRYEGETLALFALSEGEDLHLSGKTPIARTDISFHFSFSITLSRKDELFKRYVVAAITATGERVPLCTPSYPSLPDVTPSALQGFKGYHSEDFSRVMDNIPDMGIVDVYLDRLFSLQSTGILYAGEYDYYYFDQTYVTELEHRIKNLYGIGTSVYLRLLVGNSRNNLSFADEAPAGVSNRLAVLRNETAQRDLYAAVDFLTARVQGMADGLIMGRSADLVSQYSYCNATSLAQYSAFYAATLNLVAGAARCNIPDLRVLVPISDNVWEESASSLEGNGSFFRELFVPSLLSALEAQILEPQDFGLMLESNALTDRLGGVDVTHTGIDRLPAFLGDLERTAQVHTYLDPSIVFSWQPLPALTNATLHADYLLKYVTLSQNSRVHAFLLDFSVTEMQGGDTVSESIDYLAGYVNTDRCAEAAQLALSTLGVQSLEQLYADAAKMAQKRVYRTDLTVQGYISNPTLKGSASLWSFSSADDTLGWYEGSTCLSFFVSSANQETHTLVARFRGGNEYGEIAYHFDAPVDISFAPFFTMPISITGEAGTRYEVQLRFISDTAVTYASAVVNAGQSSSLYLDLSDAAFALDDLRAIRLMARPLDGESGPFELQFGGMTVQSDSLADRELSERVSAIWQNQIHQDKDEPTRDYTVPLVVSAAVVLLSVGICVLLAMSNKRKKKRNIKRS